MTVEQLLLIVGSLLIPIVGCAYWIATKLSSFESELKALREIKSLENETILTRVNRVERHVHDIRNTLQALTIALVRHGIHVEDHNDKY